MRHLTPIIVVLLCCASSIKSIAQQTYIPGYIILTNNDTLSGFLKMQLSRKASQTAVFKKEIRGRKEVYTPDQLKAYRYNDGKYYVSFPLATDGVQKQVFMEYLIKGKANVFYVHDGREHFYIQKEGGELTELTEPITYTTVNGKIYATPPKYKSKLGVILSDADVQPTIQKTSLEYKSLITLAKEYHEKVCDTEACIVYARPKNKATRDYSVFAGYTVNRYNFGDEMVTDFAGGVQVGFVASFKGVFFSNERLGFSAGIFVEKDFSSTLQPYEYNENKAMAVDYEGTRYYIRSGPDFAHYQSKLDVNLDVTSLRIPLTVNYYQPIKKSTFIIGLGASNRITLSRNEDFRIVDFTERDVPNIANYLVGVTGIIGYETKISSSKKITFNLASDYVFHNSTLFRVTQFTGRVGFTF